MQKRIFIIHDIVREHNPTAIDADSFANAIRKWLDYNAPLKYTEAYIRKIETFEYPLPPTLR
jgi:hypothetical protein